MPAPDIRLQANLWVSAYLNRLRLADIPAYVTRKGDPTAGTVLVKVALLDGTARAFERGYDMATGSRVWRQMADGPEPEVDAMLTRAGQRDPDLWVIELESRTGRTLLDEDGLSS
ncbi:MAG: DUF1491 family protein [Pseudotabrizicola sp.]|uniref:DUF1491 family protein n=1 Tax=Pseudotabrizicola sp. TaxID=2939647 RepID=UPI002715FA32|nr:DUF1491 family protein [Pseudotabrizicola sp.]MDO8883421.1 DUF1491 family protein [Pseudotabrizicola sp.]MDP2082338.1 DUF1491 family protein [Pseudotabrizicola sp.]MDZ7574336.1 DUF1491 family protein [Pseudotabrizicola sp.]